MITIKLHYKIMITVSAMIISFAIVIGYISFDNIGIVMENQMAKSALDYASTVASMEVVQTGLYEKVPYVEVQKLIESYRNETRYQYVIVMDMEGVQYSYPYSSGVGEKYKNGGEEKVLSEGVSYTSADRNELISAIRAFAPVYHNEKQVGAVLVGLLTDEVQQENLASHRNILLSLVLGLICGIFTAYLLAKNIKKATFGLEPKDIGLLLSEKELILNSLEQGMIAIDLGSQILMINEAAIKLLGNPQVAIGNNLGDYSVSLNSFLQSAIKSKINYTDEEKIINGNIKVLISTSFMMTPNDEIVGVVANVASYTHVRELAEQIIDYEGLIDSLRAQRHEFRNKLHTVSGLIQLEAYEDAMDYIDELSTKNKELHDFMSINIKDQKVAGLLLAKYNRLAEMKINVEFEKACYLNGFPENLNPEIFCSILGNLLDNSKDAICDIVNPEIKVLVQSDKDHCLIRVANNGPTIINEYKSKIYEPYFTTKEDGNGIGLSIITNEIEALNGSIEFINDQGVSWYVKIPK